MGDRGVRVNEASSPGPSIAICTANVTNLMHHIPCVASLPSDVLALQEVLNDYGQRVAEEGPYPLN